ncbi:protein-tyrosine phosphatase-like protein [Absidia repens]|uniref:Protein-tyrosine phosphatase-like protein n=1 Tax=Absidia repens TaxID=90262 RepID=A0A1X2ICN1_9FUNG|nr:protein-tyrosine phosphatase-like protein [Absidia repens]
MLIFRQEQWATYLVSKEVLEPLGLPNLYKKFLEFCPMEINQALTIFTEERNYPIHVQCSFGKDRTGLVCYLVLAICGVPDEVIVQDYAKTQAGIRPIYSELMKDLQRVGLSEDFIDASPKNMRGLIDFMKSEYGCLEDYLVKVVGFGLDQQALIRKHLCAV